MAEHLHRTYANQQTTTINDLLWTLTSGRWACRPVYQGAGFICFHPDYATYISRESTCADLFASSTL